MQKTSHLLIVDEPSKLLIVVVFEFGVGVSFVVLKLTTLPTTFLNFKLVVERMYISLVVVVDVLLLMR